MSEKKVDLEDLDLSDLGNTLSVETPIPEKPKSSKEEPGVLLNGCWVNNKPLGDVEPLELAEWIAKLLPGTNPKGFKPEQAFNTIQKREKAVDKIITIYASLLYAFPVRQLPKEYKN